MKVKNENIKSFLIMLAQYRKRHIAAMFFSLINSGLVLLQPILLMNIIDKGIMKLDLKKLITLVLFYMLIVIIQNIINIIANYLFSSIGKRFIHDLRLKLLNHVQNQPGNFQSKIETGELFTVYDSDIDNIEEVASNMIFSLFSDILVSICMCVFLIYIQPDLFIIIVLLQPVMYLTQKKYNRSCNELANKIRKELGNISKWVQTFFSHIQQFIKINGQEYFWKKYFGSASAYMDDSIKMDLVYSKSMGMANIISNFTMCVIFGFGGYKIVMGTMTIGGLISFNQYSQKLFMPLIKIVQYNIQLKKTVVSINKVYGILNNSVEIVREEPFFNGNIVKGEISFRKVFFSYDNKKYIYKGLDLDIVPNSFNGIVGESGEGKSTIINILMRLWDAEDGKILIDGINIKRYQIEMLRKQIALVTQEPLLVNDSIVNNITMENPNARMESVIEVTKKAGIYDFISALPEGFNTLVGEDGVKLSGGQKQRIAIARTLLQNAPVVILDEATSALDNNLEDYIVDKLYEVLKGKTVIIISHRFTMIRICDKINVIKDGKVVEFGTHEYLLSNQGEYMRLYSKTFTD